MTDGASCASGRGAASKASILVLRRLKAARSRRPAVGEGVGVREPLLEPVLPAILLVVIPKSPGATGNTVSILGLILTSHLFRNASKARAISGGNCELEVAKDSSVAGGGGVAGVGGHIVVGVAMREATGAIGCVVGGTVRGNAGRGVGDHHGAEKGVEDAGAGGR